MDAEEFMKEQILNNPQARMMRGEIPYPKPFGMTGLFTEEQMEELKRDNKRKEEYLDEVIIQDGFYTKESSNILRGNYEK